MYYCCGYVVCCCVYVVCVSHLLQWGVCCVQRSVILCPVVKCECLVCVGVCVLCVSKCVCVYVLFCCAVFCSVLCVS